MRDRAEGGGSRFTAHPVGVRRLYGAQWTNGVLPLCNVRYGTDRVSLCADTYTARAIRVVYRSCEFMSHLSHQPLYVHTRPHPVSTPGALRAAYARGLVISGTSSSPIHSAHRDWFRAQVISGRSSSSSSSGASRLASSAAATSFASSSFQPLFISPAGQRNRARRQIRARMSHVSLGPIRVNMWRNAAITGQGAN